jgi:hypothetical protein
MSEPSAARVAGLKGTINVRLRENVTLENLDSIIHNIVGLSGCRGCGLLGFEIVLGGDPPELQQIEKLPGVSSASFNV